MKLIHNSMVLYHVASRKLGQSLTREERALTALGCRPYLAVTGRDIQIYAPTVMQARLEEALAGQMTSSQPTDIPVYVFVGVEYVRISDVPAHSEQTKLRDWLRGCLLLSVPGLTPQDAVYLWAYQSWRLSV